MNHTQTKHSENSTIDIFSTFNNFPPFVWNLVEYKKMYFFYFQYLIYVLHTSVPPKYLFELTLTGDVTINLQLWVRLVVPRATGFWSWLWVRGVGRQLSGTSGWLRTIFQKLTKSNIWVYKCIFLTENLSVTKVGHSVTPAWLGLPRIDSLLKSNIFKSALAIVT